MGVGRVVCVALPFLLTVASLVALLVGGLGGVADKSMYMFDVNLSNFSISLADAASLLNINESAILDAGAQQLLGSDGASTINDMIHKREDGGITNLTAPLLGFYDIYQISLWGYCYTAHNGTHSCTKAKFNWAEDALNGTANDINSLLTLTGQNITLPKDVTDALKTYVKASKWAQIVFIIALVALVVEIVFGVFANCSRVVSCLTWLIAGIAAAAVCGFAALATGISVIVVGAVESVAGKYSAEGDFNKRFMAAIWIAVAFALASAFFWMFTICCCASKSGGGGSSRSSKRSINMENEKLIGSPYQPVGGFPGANGNGYGKPSQGFGGFGGGYPSQPQQQQSGKRDMAYEPYSHQRI
ncbi:SUR7/PalI family-domain-containing protein [Copromyces sp. CBS 386.78]|nr:SUR7/PalI family-domain-containing protein [Copromyces sp. CBS 386.78]